MGKHYHPGDAFAYILEGTMLLEIAGKESVTLKPGQSGHSKRTAARGVYGRDTRGMPGVSPVRVSSCPCGVVFERWVTPEEAELDLLPPVTLRKLVSYCDPPRLD
jgi:Cupin domain